MKDDKQGTSDQEAKAELWADKAIQEARQFGSFRRLADYIALDRPVTPEIRGLLLDIIEGRLVPSARYRGRSPGPLPSVMYPFVVRHALNAELRQYRKDLKGPEWSPEVVLELQQRLRHAGWQGEFPEGRKEIAAAARAIVKHRWGLTEDQLNEHLRIKNRRERALSGKSSGEIPG